jgi:hypothetical protein
MAEKHRREPTFAASNFLKQLGLGLITGASDDDPSGGLALLSIRENPSSWNQAKSKELLLRMDSAPQ